MKYINEFRDPKAAQALAQDIQAKAKPTHHYKLMEFCGGHTHALYRFGLIDLLPDNITMIHGPGCPVCVLPIGRIDKAIFLSEQPDVLFCSYGDMLRVPGTEGDSLLKAKGRGVQVKMIYSVEDALHLARTHPDKKVVFFAIGFETTTPPTAIALKQAQNEQLSNFFVYCNHVLTPVAMQAILSPGPDGQHAEIDGFIGPSHVSVIIGSDAYQAVAERHQKPVVISGFEPLDILQSISWLLDMINQGQTGIQTQYSRAVTSTGNLIAQQAIKETLIIRDQFEWRGMGRIPHSALTLHTNYQAFDAEHHFVIPDCVGKEHPACACPDILRGLKKPMDCKLFALACTPENPLGSCMVSSEGACAAHYAYRGEHTA